MADQLGLGPLENNFLAYLGTNPDVLAALDGRLPLEILSQEGKDRYLAKTFPEANGTAISEPDALKFLRTQTLAILGREIAKAQGTGSLESVRSVLELVEEAHNGLGHLPLASYANVDPEPFTALQTGIQRLDEQIQGLGKGELGVAAAPPGRCKTLFLITLSTAALEQGKDVLYISVADQSRDILVQRFDTCILGTPLMRNAPIEVVRARHKEAARRIKGHLWIADYTDRECYISDIDNIVQRCKSDLVVCDHADDVLSKYSNDLAATRHALRVVYMSLKKIAVKWDVPIWTASQTADHTWYYNSAGVAELSECKVGKSSGSSLVVVFSAGSEPQQGVVYATIAKARRNFTERVIPLSIDTATCRMW